jgi:hypothetical protein
VFSSLVFMLGTFYSMFGGHSIIFDTIFSLLVFSSFVFMLGTFYFMFGGHSIKLSNVHIMFNSYVFMTDDFYILKTGASWSYGSWIYNCLCNQCLSPLLLWIRIPFMGKSTWYNIYDKVCQWLTAGRWFSHRTPVSSINKTDCHDITEILSKVTLNTITLTPTFGRLLT